MNPGPLGPELNFCHFLSFRMFEKLLILCCFSCIIVLKVKMTFGNFVDTFVDTSVDSAFYQVICQEGGAIMATIDKNRNAQGEVVSYRLRACVGRDDQGKQVWRTCTIPRPEGLTPKKEEKEIERQADAWEQEQKAQYEKTHSKADKDKITFAEFVRDHWWTDHVMDGEHTPSSISFFRYMSNDLVSYFGPKTKLKQIDAEAVKRYIKYLNKTARTKNGEPYSAATRQHHFATLRNILEYARRFHYIEDDPCRDLSQKEKPHRERKKIDFLEPEQAVRFLSCLDSEPLFWQCLMNVLITTGLRRGEAIALQWRDLNTKKLELSIVRNVTLDREGESSLHVGKTKTGEARTVPISDRLCRLLLAFKMEQESKYGAMLHPATFIFCNDSDPYKPIRPDSVTRHVRKFVESNGLPDVSPHDLRHSAATLALESGADLKDVQTLLGHKDPSTTMKFYAGVTEEKQRRTVEGIESLIAS